jgi:DNA-binding NtrC family response regulator
MQAVQGVFNIGHTGAQEKASVDKSKRILIVDDEARVLFIMSTALRKLDANLQVETANNGRQAVQEISQQHYDLIITDLRMPDMSGVELTETIRALNPDTTVIWITAYGCYRARDESIRLSVYRCLDKPLEIGELRHVTLEALRAENG